MRVGLIGGTGVASALPPGEPLDIETPYGDVRLVLAREDRVEWLALARHGADARPAHRIDHRAHVEALARAGASAVLGVASVGALDAAVAPGSLVAPDDLLDLTPPPTFFDERAVHVAMHAPFCPEIRRALIAAGALPDGTYAQVRGPRLETPGEVRALRMLGGTLVGMTVGPEATLARERGLCYAPLCLVANSALAASAEQIRDAARAGALRAVAMALEAGRAIREPRDCGCKDSLAGARI